MADDADAGDGIDHARLDVLRRACGGRDGSAPPVLQELVAEYLETGAARLSALRSAVAAEDAAQVEHLAHALKGSSASFAAVAVANLADDLEAAARDGDLGGAAEAVRRLEEAFGRAAAALRRATG